MKQTNKISDISHNFYALQAVKGLFCLIFFSVAGLFHTFFPVVLFGFALSVQLMTLTSAHHNYTAAISGEKKYYELTIILDLFNTALICVGIAWFSLGVVK